MSNFTKSKKNVSILIQGADLSKMSNGLGAVHKNVLKGMYISYK